MKKAISLVLLAALMLPTTAQAGCNFSKDIQPGPNNTFIYSEACHKQVGQLVQDNQVKTQQVADLTKAISLKDLSLQESDRRATLWMDTSGKLEERLQKVDSLEKTNEFIYLGLGVLATGIAAYTASKLR